jgi:hypothetical protein
MARELSSTWRKWWIVPWSLAWGTVSAALDRLLGQPGTPFVNALVTAGIMFGVLWLPARPRPRLAKLVLPVALAAATSAGLTLLLASSY